MDRMIGQIRIFSVVLLLAAALALGFGARPEAASIGADGQHDPAVHLQLSEANHVCTEAQCADHHAHCSTTANVCCGNGCAALAIAEVADVPVLSCSAWHAAPGHVLSGLDPLVIQHPPRDLA
jgi:hypothetical protein